MGPYPDTDQNYLNLILNELILNNGLIKTNLMKTTNLMVKFKLQERVIYVHVSFITAV